MSSKKPKANNTRPTRRSGAKPRQQQNPFVEWLPIIILLVLGSGIWVGCHNKSVTSEDRPYKSTRPPQASAPKRTERPSDHAKQDVPVKSVDQAQVQSHTAKPSPTAVEPEVKDRAFDPIRPDSPVDAGANTRNTRPDEPAPTLTSHRTASLGSEVSSVPNAKGMVALTFDAGASAEPVDDILKALADSGSRATFFFTGKWVKKNPQTARRIVAAGHEIANHSWSHPDFTTLSDDEIVDQLNQTQQIFQTELGTPGAALFRPPFGARNKNVLSLVSSQGYRSIYWAVDCLDSVKKNITAEQIEARVLARANQGDVVLMHCGSQPTADALPSLISALKHKGLRLVSVGELLKYE